MIASIGTYLTTELPANPWEIVAMSKKSTISPNIDWPALLKASYVITGQVQPQGPDYNINPLNRTISPSIKVPQEMFNKLNEIAKASHMEPWEVIQVLIDYRFQEPA
jgi:hypothetical protein